MNGNLIFLFSKRETMVELSPESDNWIVNCVGLFASFLIFVVNIPLLWFVKHKAKPTLINKLIGLDCLIALLHIPLALEAGKMRLSPCWIR